MKCNFIGSFRLEELPNTAKPGDIAQLRLNKDQVYDDGCGHLLLDKDLIQVNKRNCWVKFDSKNISKEYDIISSTIELANDELQTILRMVDEFKDKNSRNLDRMEALECIKEKRNSKIIYCTDISDTFRFIGAFKLKKSLNELPEDAQIGDLMQIKCPYVDCVDMIGNKIKNNDYMIYSPIGWIKCISKRNNKKTEFDCIVVIEANYVRRTISSNLTFNLNELDIINKLVSALPLYEIRWGSISIEIIRLPYPISTNIEAWFAKAPRKDMDVIISSKDPEAYKKFKETVS